MLEWEYMKKFCLKHLDSLSTYKKRKLDACLTNLDKLIKDYEEQQKEKENGI